LDISNFKFLVKIYSKNNSVSPDTAYAFRRNFFSKLLS